MCRMKHIDLNKDAYELEFEEDFNAKIKFYQTNSDSKTISTLSIHKVVKDLKGIKVFTSIANQGTLQEYVEKKL